jgi:hypothetical protein
VLVVSLVAILAAAPAPAPQLASLSGLNIAALKPWLVENLPSLAQCALPSVTEGGDDVTVQARFSKSPEVTVTRVDATSSDVACVRGVLEGWKRDKKQPSAGPFAFTYKFRPSQAQRDEVRAKADAAFKALCGKLGGGLISGERLTKAMEEARPVLPMGAWVSLVDAMGEVEGQDAAKQSIALSKAMREAAKHLKVELTCAR